MFRPVYRIVWDGEPSMSGEPHTMMMGKEFPSFSDAARALDVLPSIASKQNVRIQIRYASPWREIAQGEQTE